MSKEEFISEALKPITSTAEASSMAMGEPGLPREFIWRGRTLHILEVRRHWKEAGPCRHGSGEQYVRKHCYEVVTASDGVMNIYFERQPRVGRKSARWWLHSRREEGTL